MARSRGTGLNGRAWEGTEKAWPLLCSASSHPLGGQSDADGDAGSEQGRRCRKTPPVCVRRIVIDANGRFFSGGS